MSNINSPIPGIFYRRPSPEEDPFVDVGTEVNPDTVVGLVEVMKSFHKVLAEVSGKIIKVLVLNIYNPILRPILIFLGSPYHSGRSRCSFR